MSKKDTLKIKEACLLLLSLADKWQDGKPLDHEEIDLLAWAIAENLQVRDYAMSALLMDKFESVTLTIDFYDELVSLVSDEYKHSILSILAILWYGAEDDELSARNLSMALALKPDYKLALLVQRIHSANWPHEVVQNMFNELHPTVRANVTEGGEYAEMLVSQG